ncbi:MAG: DHH family phosphoesterase [Thermoplasmata archaeon]|nr:DHH family phosphoesterase [Thermoplasmata archaeon]MCI4337822.1 DHH family phosphoesterase [Thermoplasmata archaeon]MCI4341587.1 DHH family phosphoesterase [Thermoplasmata archaeon]
MASGPERFLSDPRYGDEFTRARELLLAHPGRWRVIYHYDGDGIASATSAVRALRRLGYGLQATPLVGVDRSRMLELLHATRGPVWVVDTGATWLDSFAEHPYPVLVLDHHSYVPPERAAPDHVAFVNPLDWGVDGMSELCAATLTWLYTIFLDPKNWDNAPWGLSGAIADRQHVGGFRGLNLRLLQEAEDRQLVKRRVGVGLSGASVADAIQRSIDPYFRGLSGKREAVLEWLRGLAIEPAAALGSLAPADLERLTKSLEDRLVRQGVRPEFVAAFRQEHYALPSVGIDAGELSELQNACGRAGTPSLGVALGVGDAAALAQARTERERWRSGIEAGLARLEAGQIQAMPHLQWFESPETPLAGTQAGLGMTYLLDPNRPVAVFTTGDGVLKVSARGTHWLVGRGLDLARVCREAAAGVGGEGGGHKVASGATIPKGSRDSFLTEANRLVGEQLAGAVGGA